MNHHTEQLTIVCLDHDLVGHDDFLGVLTMDITDTQLVRRFKRVQAVRPPKVTGLCPFECCFSPQGAPRWYDFTEGVGQIKLAVKFTSTAKVWWMPKSEPFHLCSHFLLSAFTPQLQDAAKKALTASPEALPIVANSLGHTEHIGMLGDDDLGGSDEEQQSMNAGESRLSDEYANDSLQAAGPSSSLVPRSVSRNVWYLFFFNRHHLNLFLLLIRLPQNSSARRNSRFRREKNVFSMFGMCLNPALSSWAPTIFCFSFAPPTNKDTLC